MQAVDLKISRSKNHLSILTFLFTSFFLYIIFAMFYPINNDNLIYIFILSSAIGSGFLFDGVNTISAILATVFVAIIFYIISLALPLITWQYGAVTGLFVILTCQLKQAINRQGYLKNKFMMYLIATAINLFLFFGAYAWRSYF